MGLKKKRVLILGINSQPELTGIGRYTGEMVNWMVDQGYEVTMVTAFPYYPYWTVQHPYSGNFYKKEVFKEGNLTVYRCPLYVPKDPTGLKRLIHEASFFLSAFFLIVKLLFEQTHEVTISIAPPFHLGFLALFYRFFKKTKIIYHIQDMQIEAAKELGILKSEWVFKTLFNMERFILNSVDTVSTISEGMQSKVQLKCNKSVMLFPNWVDTITFYPLKDPHLLKPQWGFKPEDKLVLYSGSIGEKQGLDCLIRIAEEIKTDEHIKIIICGTGPFKSELIRMAEKLELKNIHFLPLQENEVFNAFLNIADVHLVLQKGDASDLVMPSKLTTILSVGGLALVTAKPLTSLYNTVTNFQRGVVIMPEDESLLKETILKCCKGDYSKERINARAYAETYLNKDNILKEVLSLF
jgi:colanic acid biosynthesis glycosyl transferase WcaI